MHCPDPRGILATALCLIIFAGCASTPPAPVANLDGKAASGQLEIRLFAVNDLNAFRNAWLLSDGIPDAQNESAIIQGGSVHLPILFNGCGVEDDGSCELYGRLVITDEETDEVVYRGKRVKLWSNQEAATEGMWSMATHVPNVTVHEGGNPMRIEFEVSDDVWRETAHAGLVLKTTGTVKDAK